MPHAPASHETLDLGPVPEHPVAGLPTDSPRGAEASKCGSDLRSPVRRGQETLAERASKTSEVLKTSEVCRQVSPGGPRLWDWTFVWALSPLLAIYLGVTLWSWPQGWVADEGRYLQFAANLCQGRYALADDNFLWNGPGYPLVLAVWRAAGLPPEWARLTGAGFLFLAAVLLAHWMALYVPHRWALGTAWALGLHVPLYAGLGVLMTESLAACLVCGACYAAAAALRTGRRTATLCAGVLLGCLALTKVFFGYVLLGGLLIYGVAAVARWRRPAVRRMAAIYLVGLLTAVPYLAYTYHLTGRVFYWSNCGGLSLYWMSTPYAEEWGDWFHREDVYGRPELARHRPVFDSVAALSPVDRDAAFRRRAVDNILARPEKYLRNVAANVTRIWFSFPYSYTPQKLTTLFYVLPNSLLLSGLVFAGVVLWTRRPPGVGDCHLVLVLMGLTLAGSSLLSAYARMLAPVVPCAYFLVGLAAYAVWGTSGSEKGDRSNLPRSGPEGASHKLDLSPFSGPAQSPQTP